MSHSGFSKISRKKFGREELISKHTATGPHELIFVLDHLKPGFNVAKIFRSANAFGVKEVLLIGIEHFDVRAAMGGFKHTHHKHFEDINECLVYLRAQNFSVYALSPDATQSLAAKALQKKCALIVGHEQFGLSFEAKQYPEIQLLSIPQYGEVQSLNVSVAASIAAYEYLRQHVFSKTQDHA